MRHSRSRRHAGRVCRVSDGSRLFSPASDFLTHHGCVLSYARGMTNPDLPKFAPPAYPPTPTPPPYGGQGQAPYQPYQQVTPYKSRIAAGLFGIFFGTVGVHNFYLGKTGLGVAQLLITVLSLGMLAIVSSIWGLVEGILILAKAPNYRTDGTGQPLHDYMTED
ncbi:TM2 domain-containing protein [Pseudoclavibacter sp. CFCC 13796]|nr:TM2 domain-containing protein [Pseudoclavibacter sp. CFCC 13796]